MDKLNLTEEEKQLLRDVNMRLNSTEANPQGEGYPDQQALVLPPNIWSAHRTIYIPPTRLHDI